MLFAGLYSHPGNGTMDQIIFEPEPPMNFHRRPAFALLVLLLALLAVSAASAYGFESSCPRSFRPEVTLRARGAVFTASGSGERISLPEGTVLPAEGEKNGSYTVLYNGQSGLVEKGKANLSASASEEEIPEYISDSLGLKTVYPTQGLYYYVPFIGELRAPAPVDQLCFFLWDERSAALETACFMQLREPTAAVDASRFDKLISLSHVAAGRKTLVIQGYTDGAPAVLARFYFILRGVVPEAPNITEACSEGLPWEVLSGKLTSAWYPTEKDPCITVRIPEGESAALLTMEWEKPPESFFVSLRDRRGEIISETAYATGMYADSVKLDGNVGSVCITPVGNKCGLITLRVYPEGYPSWMVQSWEPLPEKVDLMLFSAHQDDEALFFGGMIPYYSDIGKTVAVVYMTNCGRTRYREALDGLWTMGLRYHPIFMEWRDGKNERIATLEWAMGAWKKDVEDPLRELVRLIRLRRPEVVVTHDFNGEYGNGQHKLTAVLISEAAVLAGDPSYDAGPDAEPWEVRKVYIHLYESGQIYLDWSQPLSGQTEITPIMLATEAYDKHRTQHPYYSMEKEGVEYDNRLFGLYYSTVGEDKDKDDLFENIP